MEEELTAATEDIIKIFFLFIPALSIMLLYHYFLTLSQLMHCGQVI